MYLKIPLVLILFLIISLSESSFGQNNQSEAENSSIIRDDLSLSEREKIHQTLARWQNSENPEEFSQKLNLPHKGDKILVYIYLEHSKFESEFPSDIELISSSQNILRAFVTSEDLYLLEDLDFVTKITPPELAQSPPIPRVDITEFQPKEENTDFWALILLVLIIIPIIILIKRARKKQNV